jgi:GNAT superfamily N-acetyltransferase
VPTSIGYSGSNHILGVIEIRDGNQYRTTNPDGGSIVPMILHYGTMPQDFWKQWNERNGAKVELQKAAAEHISPADSRDALQLLKDWSFEYGVNWRNLNIDQVFQEALASAQLQDVPLNQLRIHHDWGRRPKRKKPIIVGKTQDGHYIVLDGQHRILVAKEAGETTISAYVLSLPLVRVSRGRSYRYTVAKTAKNYSDKWDSLNPGLRVDWLKTSQDVYTDSNFFGKKWAALTSKEREHVISRLEKVQAPDYNRKEAALIRTSSGNQNLVLKAVTKLLGENKIGSIVVGGVAVQQYGYPRNTKDIDLSVTDANKAMQVLVNHGYKQETEVVVFDPQYGEEINILQGGKTVAACDVPLPIPTETNITPEFCGLATLIDLKIGSYLGARKVRNDRDQDRVDILKLIKRNQLPRDLLQGKKHQEEYEITWDDMHKPDDPDIDKISNKKAVSLLDPQFDDALQRLAKEYAKSAAKKEIPNPLIVTDEPEAIRDWNSLSEKERNEKIKEAPIRMLDPQEFKTSQETVNQDDLDTFLDDPEKINAPDNVGGRHAVHPVILDTNEGRYVSDGNHRCAAAKILKREVKVIYIDLRPSEESKTAGYRDKHAAANDISALTFEIEDNDEEGLGFYSWGVRAWTPDRLRTPYSPQQNPVGYLDVLDMDDTSWVFDINVEDDWRGLGLGQALYYRAISEAKKRGKKFFESSSDQTPEAHAAWQRLAQRYSVEQKHDLGTMKSGIPLSWLKKKNWTVKPPHTRLMCLRMQREICSLANSQPNFLM